MDKKEITKAINKLPICEDGKNGVKDLVKALGFDVEPDKPKLPEIKAGQVWRDTKNHIFLILGGGTDCIYLNDGGNSPSWVYNIKYHRDAFVELISNKGKEYLRSKGVK